MYSGLDAKIWHGESNIAEWNAFGGNRRDYESMFDNNFSTYWVGHLPVTEQNKVVVTFKKPVEFHGLYIVARPADKEYFGGSYQSMCLVLDDDIDGKICTSPDYAAEVGQVVRLASVKKSMVTKVELIIQNGEVGQIADFKIYYKGTLTLFLIMFFIKLILKPIKNC